MSIISIEAQAQGRENPPHLSMAVTTLGETFLHSKINEELSKPQRFCDIQKQRKLCLKKKKKLAKINLSKVEKHLLELSKEKTFQKQEMKNE